MAVGLLGGALLVMPLPWRLRALGLPLMLPLLAPPLPRPAMGEFEVVAADIGQGTAVLVRTRSRLLLYDAGPRYSTESEAAQRVLLPLLRARRRPHGPAGAQPPRHRPCRRGGVAAERSAGGRSGQFAARGASAAGRRRAAPPLRRRPGLGMGGRALRAAASAGQ